MKIEEDSTSSASTSNMSDMPPASAKLLRSIKHAQTTEEFIDEINKGRDVHSIMGKTELIRWVEVLNRCDEILETAVSKTKCGLLCDNDVKWKKYTVAVIRFTVLLFECTSSRRVYRSMDRILLLMETTDMDLLAEVLRLLQTMGKRSKYLTQRLTSNDQNTLVHNLTAIAQSWGGKLRTVKMAECVRREPNLPAFFPFTFTDERQRSISIEKPNDGECVAQLVNKYMSQLSPPSSCDQLSPPYSREDHYCLLSRLRMLKGFDQWNHRFKCLIVRLLSVSTLIYSRCQTDLLSVPNPVSALLYSGFVEEIVSLLKTERESDCNREYSMLDSIHTEALATLCSIVNYEKEPKLGQILEALSAGSYHGYLSVLTRQVVDELKNNNLGKPGKPTVALSTALFSFIYHLASIEPGGETLVGSGLTQTLLSVIGYHDLPLELITFGTRCARIIDLFTTIDVTAFKTHNGMETCVNRIVHEINECRKEQPFMIDTSYDMKFENEPPQEASSVAPDNEGVVNNEAQVNATSSAGDAQPMEVETAEESKKDDLNEIKGGPWIKAPNTGLTCHQQRSGLIKGLLTFVKRAIQDAQFNDSIRNIMEGGLPDALMHILSNAEYYSPSLFHQSSQLITNYVYQNPEELSVLQRRHVPYVLYQSILRKELPNSRDVITTIGSVFTAMCLNERGLKQFKSYEPFDQIWRILLSVKFLVTAKKKRTEMTESAHNIGSAVDDLLRHYPDLKIQMLKSSLKVLSRMINVGQNPPPKTEIVMALAKHVAKNVVLNSSGPATALTPLPPLNVQTEPEILQQPGVQDQATPVPQEDTEATGEPMELEEESDMDEEAEMSMDEMSGEGIVATTMQDTIKPITRNLVTENDVGLDMTCDDGTGKKLLPLGDYMIITAKIFETLLTQTSNLRMIDEFITMGGIEKMLTLCQLPCLHNEIAQSTFAQSIANIVKFIVFQKNSDSSPRLMKSVMGMFVKTISPIFENKLQFPELNKADTKAKPAASMLIHVGEKTIFETLTNLNNILPVLSIISKSSVGSTFTSEIRNRVFETWKTPEGVQLYSELRKLSRMLVWESALIRVLKPSIRNCATQTEPGEIGEQNSQETSLVTSNVDVDSVEKKEPKEKAWVLAGINEEEYTFWTQHKQLADLVTKSCRGITEMLNLIARSINLMIGRRARRQDIQIVPQAAQDCISMIFSSIYKDLKWSPNGMKNTSMGYARYAELLTQLSVALFDERGNAGNSAIIHQFYTSGCHEAFFELMTNEIVPSLDGYLPEGLEDVMSEWCRLAKKLADRTAIIVAPESLLGRGRGRSGNADFDCNKYLKLVCRDIFNVFTKLFEELSSCDQSDLHTFKYICENSFIVFKEVAKNLTQENELSDNPLEDTWVRQVRDNNDTQRSRNDENQVLMLMDMGFTRPTVLAALSITTSTDAAINYLLSNQGTNPMVQGQQFSMTFPHELESMVEQIMRMQRTPDGMQSARALAVNDQVNMPDNLRNSLANAFDNANPEEVSPIEVLCEGFMQSKKNTLDDIDNIALPLIPPLSSLKIEQDISLQSASIQLIPLIKRLLNVSSELVYTCSDLLTSVLPAMSTSWLKNDFITLILTDEIKTLCDEVLGKIEAKPSSSKNISQGDKSKILSNRVHFACLMFDKIAEDYIEVARERGLIDSIISLMALAEEEFNVSNTLHGVLARIVLWLDLYDKYHHLLSRKALLKSMTPNGLEWSYLIDDPNETGRRREKKWVEFDESAQKVINEKFYAGYTSMKTMVKRGNRQPVKMEIDFGTMQMDDGNVRDAIKAKIPKEQEINIESIIESEKILTWKQDENCRLVFMTVQLLKKGSVNVLCAQSLLSFAARLTMYPQNASKFMELGGVEYVVRLRCPAQQSSQMFASMIVRNCIEDANLQSYVDEKTLKSIVNATPAAHLLEYLPSRANVPRGWNQTLFKCAPLAARNPSVFISVVDRICRLKKNMMSITGKDKEKKGSTNVEASSSKSSNNPKDEGFGVSKSNDKAQKIVDLILDEILHGEFPIVGSVRMFSQEKLLSLLAEIVKSYPAVAILITEAKDSGKSALHTLIETYIYSPDKTQTMFALRTLVSVIASCTNRAQEMLVQDVKGALLSFCEKAKEIRKEGSCTPPPTMSASVETVFGTKDDEKSVVGKIMEICALIVTMCESCPASRIVHTTPNEARPPPKNSALNSIMKLFHKKRICNDLVKAITYLNLSSKDSIDAVNQILKTLEVLMDGLGVSLPHSAAHAILGIANGSRTVGRMEVGVSTSRENEEDEEDVDEESEAGRVENQNRELQVHNRIWDQMAHLWEEDGRDQEDNDERSEISEHPSESMSEFSSDERRHGDAAERAVEEGVTDGAIPLIEQGADQLVGGAIQNDVDMQEERNRDEAQNGNNREENEQENEDDEEDDDDDEDEDDDDEDDDDDDDEDDDDDDDADDDGEHAMEIEAPIVVHNGTNSNAHIVHQPIRRILDDDGDSMEEDHEEFDMLDDDYFERRLNDRFHGLLGSDFIGHPRGPLGMEFAELLRNDDFDIVSGRERRASQRAPIPAHSLLARPTDEENPPRTRTYPFRQDGPTFGFMSRNLHRQNAIRRPPDTIRAEMESMTRNLRTTLGNLTANIGAELPTRIAFRESTNPGSFLERIFDFGTGNARGGLSSRAYRTMITMEPGDERGLRTNDVMTCLQRLEGYTRIMDDASTRFLVIILINHLTRKHQAREIAEKAAAEEKAKKEAEVAKKDEEKQSTDTSPEEVVLVTPAATNTTNTVSESTAPNASRNAGQETSTTQAIDTTRAVAEEVAGEQEEPMEVGDDDSRLPQSTAATTASSVAGTDELEDQNVDVSPSTEQPPPTEQQQDETVQPLEISEEFRAILGDIDIPQGVDPAFLAALPEDMRAEVIRDYQRQQRAERASRPVAPVPAAADSVPPVNSEQGEQREADRTNPAPVANTPLVEPINQEFLNALPPELQEEILAEHERAVREAEEASRRANAPVVVEPELDGAAVIASLPAIERAQVLAEMDETELSRLPQAMQDEARRARVQHIDPNVLRYHRMIFRRNNRGIHRNGAPTQGPHIGQNAGQTMQAAMNAPHLLDRESIMTLCLLYLVDPRLSANRLQKVLKNACINSTTCDFVIWCLLALLDKASEANADDEEIVSNIPAWLDSISVSGVGHNERALRVSENCEKVSIHSMLSVPVCRNILDLLAIIAKAYPGNFLPLVLRNGAKKTDVAKESPSFNHFWAMVQNSTKVPTKKEWTASLDVQLEESPIGQLMNYLEKPIIEKTGQLQDRVMKVSSTILQTLPNDSCALLEISDPEYKPFSKHIRFVIDVMTRGQCTPDGLSDGLTILSECMRTFNEATIQAIYSHLFTAVSKLGQKLLPQIDHLIKELVIAQRQDLECQDTRENPVDEPSTSSKTAQLVVDTTNGGRVAHGRFDSKKVVIDGEQNAKLMMSSCKELQLPAVTVLTDKAGAQYSLLSALQTLVKVRNHMRSIRKEKKKREKEEEEKKKKKNKEEVEGEPAKKENEKDDDAKKEEDQEIEVFDKEPRISEALRSLNPLWDSLSDCLQRLGQASDPYAVLALQPAAESFFLVHASEHKPKSKEDVKRKESEAASSSGVAAPIAVSMSQEGSLKEEMDPDTAKLIDFAEKHRQVLNQALRQNNEVLSPGGPFAILTQFPKLLDFDVKRKYFRKELNKTDSAYRRNDVSVQVNRSRVFSDSFRELFRLRPSDWKNRFYIIFQGEEGQDAGGLLREWFSVITREIFNPNYALFITAPGDMVTYMINKASYINPEHLEYFKFVGRIIAKSIYEHKYLDCYFTRAFYKHILNLPVRYQDLESEDPAFFKSLEFLLQNPIDDIGLDLTFSTEVEEFGVRSVRDLIVNGRKIEVNDANKEEYVKLVCQMKMTGSIRKQLDAFLQGFYEIIPKELISMFNEQELELLISGLPTVDVDDLAANTDYKGYQKTSVQIQWFWRALRSFEKEDKAKFLQFVTGTSKVPLQGFATLEGMNGVQKFSVHLDSRGGDRLPAAHTCFNQLDLPQYESYDKLRDSLLLAIRECTEGFGFA